MRPLLVLALLASSLSPLLPAQTWGDVVTADLSFSHDIGFDGVHPVGLTVAASGVRIDLAGHKLDGLDGAAVGIHVLPGVDGVTIQGGTLRGCRTQVFLEGHASAHSSGHRLTRLNLTRGTLGPGGQPLRDGSGVRVRYADDIRIDRCRFTLLEGSGVDAYASDRLSVADCEFRQVGTGDLGGAAGAGISVSGAAPSIARNSFLLVDGPAVLLRGTAAGYPSAGGGSLTENRASRCLSRPVAGRDLGVLSVVDGWTRLVIGGNVLTQYQRSLGASVPTAVGIGLANAQAVRVLDNTLRGLQGTGGIDAGPGCSDLVALGNLIDGNGVFGLRLQPGGGAVDARFNWWGDPSGPAGVGPGTGDPVLVAGGGAVDFSNWNRTEGRHGLRGTLGNGTEASGCALGDLDLDGLPELLTALAGAGTVAVHQNQAGSFTGPAPAYPAGAFLGRLAVATIDPGIAPDVVVADPGAGAVVVLLGDGQGGLGPPTATAVGVAPTAVVAGDLDGDGWNDLLVVDPGWPLLGGRLSWLRNDANGAWAGPPVELSDVGAWEDAALHDLDGDGDRDLVAADAGSLYPSSVRRLLVRYNDGLGSFGPPLELPLPVDPRRVLVGDLDGDGWTDVAVAGLGDAGEQGGIAWFRGSGAGLGAPTLLDAGLHAPVALAFADATGDGVPDLIAADAAWGALVALPGPDLGLAPPHGIGSGEALLEVLAGDLDRDGLPDLLSLEPQRGVLDHRGVRRPLERIYGAACAGGSGNVPEIGLVGAAYRDNPAFIVTLSGAKPFTTAYLLAGRQEIADPHAGGCTLLVGQRFNPLFSVSTDANGNAERAFWLNPEANFIRAGIDLYGQWAVLDPGGGALGTWALSDGLHVLPGY